ncbi:MAG: pyridoxamine 5'-phosphate oxidase family protein [Candidatus Bathyarchaeia archaeon]
MPLKLVRAAPFYAPMMEEEARRFLTETKTLLRIGTIGPGSYPDVHVVWYTFQNDKIYTTTVKGNKKYRNLQANSKVGFSIDTEAAPYKGVRGRAKATVIDDSKVSGEILTKNVLKYMGTVDSPPAKAILSLIPQEVAIELTPSYLATWDASKKPKATPVCLMRTQR